jgi:uncharacterized protein YegP (UPF0339 family)
MAHMDPALLSKKGGEFMYYQKWKDGNGQWRWHLRGANHEIISHGESYVNESGCDHAISLNKASSNAPVLKA